jgi:Domain of Unknown Function (DUF1259)
LAHQQAKGVKAAWNDQEDMKMRTSISGIGFALTLAFAAQAHATEIDWTKVDAALGKTASVQGQVHRYGIPRSDLQVTLDGVAIKPALALGGMSVPPAMGTAIVINFQPTGGGKAAITGDFHGRRGEPDDPRPARE